MSGSSRRSIVIVQYAGDYAQTFRQLSAGGAETYYAQRYSIEEVAALVGPMTAVATICCTADVDEDTILSNGVRAINMRSPRGVDELKVWAAIRSCDPTHLCLRTPLREVLADALRDRAIESILLTLADSYNDTGMKARFRAWQMARLLNSPKVVAVGNHGRNSSESLRRIGVDPRKIIPWDWPHDVSPSQFAAKELAPSRARNLLFVGALNESKGIGDVMRAVQLLRQRGLNIRLSYAGRGETSTFAELSRSLGIDDYVNYLGVVAHAHIVPLMHAADLIVVPSRHEYPEGFPMTLYEALSSRTPIVASDHPMYARHLAETGAAVIYAAGDHAALADAVEETLANPAAYGRLSEASAASWDRLQLPVTWGALLRAWLDQPLGKPFGLLVHALQPSSSVALSDPEGSEMV
jgi:glycosyltransferase involved in cell wall biosynthesis